MTVGGTNASTAVAATPLAAHLSADSRSGLKTSRDCRRDVLLAEAELEKAALKEIAAGNC
jgi:hypothetical protein